MTSFMVDISKVVKKAKHPFLNCRVNQYLIFLAQCSSISLMPTLMGLVFPNTKLGSLGSDFWLFGNGFTRYPFLT